MGYFIVTRLDPSQTTCAEFGFRRAATEEYGCTHRIDAFENGKQVHGTVHKGDSSAQIEIAALKRLSFVERQP